MNASIAQDSLQARIGPRTLELAELGGLAGGVLFLAPVAVGKIVSYALGFTGATLVVGCAYLALK